MFFVLGKDYAFIVPDVCGCFREPRGAIPGFPQLPEEESVTPRKFEETEAGAAEREGPRRSISSAV